MSESDFIPRGIGEAEPVFLGGVARNAVAGLRQIFAADPHAGEARVFLDVARIGLAPRAWHHHSGEHRKAERDGLEVIACPSRESYPRVSMMQAGQDWRGDNGPRSLDRSS
jgi:hypothetical protein